MHLKTMGSSCPETWFGQLHPIGELLLYICRYFLLAVICFVQILSVCAEFLHNFISCVEFCYPVDFFSSRILFPCEILFSQWNIDFQVFFFAENFIFRVDFFSVEFCFPVEFCFQCRFQMFRSTKHLHTCSARGSKSISRCESSGQWSEWNIWNILELFHCSIGQQQYAPQNHGLIMSYDMVTVAATSGCGFGIRKSGKNAICTSKSWTHHVLWHGHGIACVFLWFSDFVTENCHHSFALQ